jgi:hypothetical protein
MAQAQIRIERAFSKMLTLHSGSHSNALAAIEDRCRAGLESPLIAVLEHASEAGLVVPQRLHRRQLRAAPCGKRTGDQSRKDRDSQGFRYKRQRKVCRDNAGRLR